MSSISATGNVAKYLPKALRIFRWWVGFADENGVGEKAIARLMIKRPLPIGRIGKGRFFRMWPCDRMVCAGSFRACMNQLWQIIFSEAVLRPDYVSIHQIAAPHGS